MKHYYWNMLQLTDCFLGLILHCTYPFMPSSKLWNSLWNMNASSLNSVTQKPSCKASLHISTTPGMASCWWHRVYPTVTDSWMWVTNKICILSRRQIDKEGIIHVLVNNKIKIFNFTLYMVKFCISCSYAIESFFQKASC